MRLAGGLVSGGLYGAATDTMWWIVLGTSGTGDWATTARWNVWVSR